MITLDREEAEEMLAALDIAAAATQQPVAEQVWKALRKLRVKLHEYPKHKVTPHEFVATATGKENLIGMPIIWAEWPMREETTGEQQ